MLEEYGILIFILKFSGSLKTILNRVYINGSGSMQTLVMSEVRCPYIQTEEGHLFSEPNGAVRPRVTSKTIDVKEIMAGGRVVALCPGQGFPVPMYR